MAKYIIYQEAKITIQRCVVVDAPNASSATQKGKVEALKVPWSYSEELDNIKAERTIAVEVPRS